MWIPPTWEILATSLGWFGKSQDWIPFTDIWPSSPSKTLFSSSVSWFHQTLLGGSYEQHIPDCGGVSVSRILPSTRCQVYIALMSIIGMTSERSGSDCVIISHLSQDKYSPLNKPAPQSRWKLQSQATFSPLDMFSCLSRPQATLQSNGKIRHFLMLSHHLLETSTYVQKKY